MDRVRQNGVNMIWRITCSINCWSKVKFLQHSVEKEREKGLLRLISPGTGRIRSPIIHSPLVPALPPMGGLPPTSTTLKTSTSSGTSPERARAIVKDKVDEISPSRKGGDGDKGGP